MDYYSKYIKYKTKYLKLSNMYQIGGSGYKNTTVINDYKNITWYFNSCYFSVAMWFLWTLIPFRQFIYNYSGDEDGFKAIKELFDEFNDNTKPEPVNIEEIYRRVQQFFTKEENIYKRDEDGKIIRDKNGNNIVIRRKKPAFGSQQSSAELIENILDMTKNKDLLNKIRLKFNTTTKCSDGKKEENNSYLYITYSTNDINIFNEETTKLDIERCMDLGLGLGDTNGIKITKLDLVNDDNEYFILQFIEEQKYNNVKEIKYNGKIFKIKSVVSYSGEIIVNKTNSGHYISYVFDDNGLNPFVLDDLGEKNIYEGDLNEIKINSLVLYKLSTPSAEKKEKVDSEININFIPQGVLGICADEKDIKKQNVPDETIIVDPAGLGFIKGNPNDLFKGAEGAAGAIYDYFSLRMDLSREPLDNPVSQYKEILSKKTIDIKEGQALINYLTSYNQLIIHAVGYDFRDSNNSSKTKNEAIEMMKGVYLNIFELYKKTMKNNNVPDYKIRIPLISSSIFAGKFAGNDMIGISYSAIMEALKEINFTPKELKQIYICLYLNCLDGDYGKTNVDKWITEGKTQYNDFLKNLGEKEDKEDKEEKRNFFNENIFIPKSREDKSNRPRIFKLQEANIMRNKFIEQIETIKFFNPDEEPMTPFNAYNLISNLHLFQKLFCPLIFSDDDKDKNEPKITDKVPGGMFSELEVADVDKKLFKYEMLGINSDNIDKLKKLCLETYENIKDIELKRENDYRKIIKKPQIINLSKEVEDFFREIIHTKNIPVKFTIDKEEDKKAKEEDEEEKKAKEEADKNCKSKGIEPYICNNKEDYNKQAKIFKKSNNADCIDEAKNKMKKLYEICKEHKGITIDTESDEEFKYNKDDPPSSTEAEKLFKEEADRKAKEANKAKEEADRKAKEEANKAKEEADRKAKEEANKAKEEANKAKEEADRKAKEEADRKAKEANKAKEEANKAKEEANKAKEEADRKAKEEADIKAKEEADRKEVDIKEVEYTKSKVEAFFDDFFENISDEFMDKIESERNKSIKVDLNSILAPIVPMTGPLYSYSKQYKLDNKKMMSNIEISDKITEQNTSNKELSNDLKDITKNIIIY
jgi:hypothetical protein